MEEIYMAMMGLGLGFMYLSHMIMSEVAFSLGLIAIIASVSLVVWGMRHEGVGTGFAKVVGTIALIASILTVLATLYDTMKFRNEALYLMPHHMFMQHQMMQNPRLTQAPGMPPQAPAPAPAQ